MSDILRVRAFLFIAYLLKKTKAGFLRPSLTRVLMVNYTTRLPSSLA